MNRLQLSSAALLLLATACQERSVSAPAFRGRATPNAVVFPPGSIPATFAAAIKIDKANKAVILPLFRGVTVGGGATYSILTESSDFREAVRLGGVLRRAVESDNLIQDGGVHAHAAFGHGRSTKLQ
jgi:hypothetical protein